MKDTRKYSSIHQKRSVYAGRFFCFWWMFMCLLPARGQVRDYTNSFKEKRSLYFTWDSKITFISNRYAQVKSIKLGFGFGKKTTFGVGYNWYKGNIVREFGAPEGVIKTANLKFRYLSLFTEYVYFMNDKWEATIPAQVGMGIMQYNREFSKNRVDGAGGFFMLYEPTSTITYRFLRYFGVGAGIGYRLVILLGTNPQKEQLQSPVIMIRTKLYFDTLWQDIRKKMKKK